MQEPPATPRPPGRSPMRWVVGGFHLAMTVWFLVALARAVGTSMRIEAGGNATDAGSGLSLGAVAGIWLAGGLVLTVIMLRAPRR